MKQTTVFIAGDFGPYFDCTSRPQTWTDVVRSAFESPSKSSAIEAVCTMYLTLLPAAKEVNLHLETAI